ncbi:kinase-like domain-containing protein [Mycena vulgaris]|nr:kinase-like domain-containing protein [Mycena vulgaris]
MIIFQILQKDLPQKHRSEAWKMMLRISSSHDQLPASMFITGVTHRNRDSKFAGGFSDIYRAWYNGKPVALKRLRVNLVGPNPRTARQKLYREALLWHKLHNPYILPFIGVDRESFSPDLCLVSPWMKRGTILKYLAGNARKNVNRLLSEVAQGIQYLHSQGIVHGDLRGNNIFITSEWTACVGDFGLSSFSENSEDPTQQVGMTRSELSESGSSTTTQAGSPRWMAPELISPERHGISVTRTPASDIYAFGCLCVELYTGRIPFSTIENDPVVMMKVLDGVRPDRPTERPAMSDALWDLVNACWAHDPASRPSMQTVVENMKVFTVAKDRAVAGLYAPELQLQIYLFIFFLFIFFVFRYL